MFFILWLGLLLATTDALVYVLREEGKNNSTILSCELSGDDAWSAVLWSGDTFEQTRKLAKQKHRGDLFRNQTQDPITRCERYDNAQPLCRATGWDKASEGYMVERQIPIGPILDIGWENDDNFIHEGQTATQFPRIISASVLASNSLSIDFEFKNSDQNVRLVLNENVQGMVSTTLYKCPSSSSTRICTEALVTRPGLKVLDPTHWVHLSFELRSLSGSPGTNEELIVSRHGDTWPLLQYTVGNIGIRDPGRNYMMLVSVLNSEKTALWKWLFYFDILYTTTIKPFNVNLNGDCWKIVYFGQLLVNYKNNMNASELPGQTQLLQENNGWQLGEIRIPSMQNQYEITFTPEKWVRDLWAIRILSPCYESRVRRVEVDSNTDLDSIRCTVLLSGNSAVLTTTTTTETTTLEILKQEQEQADEPIPKSDDCKNMWFWIAVICLVIFALILLYINIKCLMRRDVCTRKKDNFSAFRGGKIGEKLFALNIDSNKFSEPNVRYSTGPGNSRNAMPDEIIVTDYDEETKVKSMLSTPGFMAPAMPSSPRPMKRAVTPVLEVDEEEDDDEPRYGNYTAKNTGFENPNFKDEFPQYGNYVSNDETALYGNVR